MMIESDAQDFRDVNFAKLPRESAYTLGFVTTRTPAALADSAGHDAMLTLFLPPAPNPVMGRHLAHLPESRVIDVEMTVEEGVRTVVTSGVADSGPDDPGFSASDRREVAETAAADRWFDPGAERSLVRLEPTTDPDSADRYDAQVDPGHAVTAEDIARRERAPGRGEATVERPAAAADWAVAEREATDGRSVKMADDPNEAP